MGAEPFSFNLFKAIGATAAFLLLLLLFDRQIHIQTLFYGAVYGIFVTVSMYTGLMGLATGPMALTSMIASFSLIIPTAYGIIVLDEKIGAFGMIGLSLLFISMVLFAARRKDKFLGRSSAKGQYCAKTSESLGIYTKMCFVGYSYREAP